MASEQFVQPTSDTPMATLGICARLKSVAKKMSSLPPCGICARLRSIVQRMCACLNSVIQKILSLQAGVLGDVFSACLVSWNCVQTIARIQRVAPWILRDQYLSEIYFLNLCSPFLRIVILIPVCVSIYKAGRRIVPALVMPGDGMCLLAREAAKRTEFVFKDAPQGDRICGKWKKREWERLRSSLHTLSCDWSKDEQYALRSAFPPPDIQNADSDNCCGKNDIVKEVWWFQTKPACSSFALFAQLLNPFNSVYPYHVLPQEFCFLLKLQLYGAIFGILTYALVVAQQITPWWSPSYLLQLVLSIYSLYSLKDQVLLLHSNHWPAHSLGVIINTKFGREDIWSEWCIDISRLFNWGTAMDVWTLLQDIEEPVQDGARHQSLLGLSASAS